MVRMGRKIEIWKEIKGYYGLYEISDLGRVKSYNRLLGEFLKPGRSSSGYLTVCLSNKAKRTSWGIHKLLAIHFFPNKENKKYVNHKDGDKINNSLNNLEWCTSKENALHAWRTGLVKRQEKKLKTDDVKTIKCMLKNRNEVSEIQGFRLSDAFIARLFEVSVATIYDIKKGRTWSNIRSD